ncbi:unnamed protein product [Discosporangium mesarthrocarpum]
MSRENDRIFRRGTPGSSNHPPQIGLSLSARLDTRPPSYIDSNIEVCQDHFLIEKHSGVIRSWMASTVETPDRATLRFPVLPCPHREVGVYISVYPVICTQLPQLSCRQRFESVLTDVFCFSADGSPSSHFTQVMRNLALPFWTILKRTYLLCASYPYRRAQVSFPDSWSYKGRGCLFPRK